MGFLEMLDWLVGQYPNATRKFPRPNSSGSLDDFFCKEADGCASLHRPSHFTIHIHEVITLFTSCLTMAYKNILCVVLLVWNMYFSFLVNKFSKCLCRTNFTNLATNDAWSLLLFYLKVPCLMLEGSSEEDQEGSGGETELPEVDAHGVDQELKHHLLKKYSGYLSSLKQELSKKKKKGKLPKEARQQLLSWWDQHYKWPYPSVRLLFILPF